MNIARRKFFCKIPASIFKPHFKVNMATLVANEVDAFINGFNKEYERKHVAYENNFWATKMNLAGNSPEAERVTKMDLDSFLGSKDALDQVRTFLGRSDLTTEQTKVLKCFEKTFNCYIIEDPKALEMKSKIAELEGELAQFRNHMNLGYVNPADGKFVKMSSVQLRNTMNNDPSEEVRKACYEGMRSIGDGVAEKFAEIVVMRNRFAKLLGYKCFYDMKVSQAEGFNKETLFSILDPLEERTRSIMQEATDTLIKEKGESAVHPWNTSYVTAGNISKLKNPYFPFENAVESWARSFAALGITYKGATMNLDLCDREGKYSNGFCHWPQPAWKSSDGTWVPSQTNFTSLATPSAVGSGYTALVTLMHEGGHAAHFANVTQGSPLFSQERSPTSVAYAENQSMFLDSLCGDAAWMGRYAVSTEGQVIPWEIIEQQIRETHKYEVRMLRSMLAVPYFEKRLYDMDESDMTAEKIKLLADEVERDIQGGPSARPLMSVPHILSDESAGYYHGYVLAEMSVHQTRDHFLKKYGEIVDNEQVGKDLREFYWAPGNSEQFMTLVQGLTGKPLSGDAWVEKLEASTASILARERQEYASAVMNGPKFSPGHAIDLEMRIKLVHGDAVVADTAEAGSLAGACDQYKRWLKTL